MTPDVLLAVARQLLDIVLALVPAPVAQQLLDDAAVRRAHAIADAAEAAKFSKFADEDEP